MCREVGKDGRIKFQNNQLTGNYNVTNMVKRIWTTLKRDNEQRFTEYKKKCESELDEERDHRDQIWDENDKLKETLNLQKTITYNQEKNIKRLESSVEELRQKLRDKSSLLSTLQGQYDVLKKILKGLPNGKLTKIKSNRRLNLWSRSKDNLRNK